MANTDWWAVYPDSEKQSGNNVPAGTTIISTTAGTAEDRAFTNTQSYNGLMRLMGPFSTKSAAENAQIQTPSGWTTLGDALGQASTVPGSPIAGAPQVASAAWDAATAIPRFLSMVTNKNLWLRMGEVACGLILLGIGVNSLFHGQPMSKVTNAAGKLAPLALA